jgi:phosphoglycerate dehydrogenase-like enzyme
VAKKIVFASRLPPAIVDTARAMVPPGFEMTAVDHGTPAFYEALHDAEFYLGFPRPGMGNEFFRAAPRLRLVQLVTAGYDTLDLEAARKAGVPVANCGGSNAVSVAEHTITLMLAVLKRLVWQHNNVVAGKWRVGDFAQTRCYEVEGKVLGLVGLGNIGKKVARKANGLDMRVQYYDIRRLTEAEEDALGVRFVLFRELLATSDVVSLHVPLDETTRNLMSARELGTMKPGAVLINTCRGPIVDEAALYAALTSGPLAAAGLDVLVEEPAKPGHPLFGLENVTFTPHAAGPTWESWGKAFRNGFDNIQRVAAGRPPLWVVPELRETGPA